MRGLIFSQAKVRRKGYAKNGDSSPFAMSILGESSRLGAFVVRFLKATTKA